jgi:hypothetical protein
MVDTQTSEVVQNMYYSTWDHENVYAYRSSKDEQLLTVQFLLKPKITNVEGSWKLKFIFCFKETNSWNTALKSHEVWYTKRAWAYQQVLFQ